ncbi:MAG: cyclic nucleotide-binding protein [Alphaproteobacteria bacterium]|nr:cyclic nucleotide-binding protein [Alphaproteobacteria bacterium]
MENINELLQWLPDFIGCLGAIVVLVAYVMLQSGRIKSEQLAYSFLNVLGAVMILYSLTYAWNLAAVGMELAWLGISVFGILKCLFSQRAKVHKIKIS